MGGDLLWTVNGKPAFYSNGQLYLGTSMARPFVVTETSAFAGSRTNTQVKMPRQDHPLSQSLTRAHAC